MNRIKIEFLDAEYSISSDADESYINEIAKYLESKVRKANKDNSTIKVSTPFLLASLEIVDDFFRLKKEFEGYKKGAEQKSKNFIELLDSSKYYESVK